MRKLLNNPWAVGMLVVVAVASIWMSTGSERRTARGTAAIQELVESADDSDTDVPTDEPPASAGHRSIEEVVMAIVLPKQIRDPFALRPAATANDPAAESEREIETVRLSAIWNQAGAYLLLVNGRICEVGTAIGRISIESASLEGVWLTHPNGRDFLRMGGEFSLVTPVVRASPNPATVALHEN